MFKESLIMVILTVVIYQLYIVYYPAKELKKFRKRSSPKQIPISEDKPRKVINKLPERKPMQYETPQSFEHPTLGKPDKIIPEGYLFIIRNPNPWSAIVYNQNTQSYLFIIKLNDDPTTIQRYSQKIMQWSKIIKNISFNTQSNELVVPSIDEDSALAVTNLILNNLKGDLPLQNIIDNNLIQISIAKIKNYSSVKQKIKEQILENVFNKKVSQEESLEYQEDLAETATASPNNPSPSPKETQPSAYEGLEFSYL